MAYIYKITNKINGKCYIGKTQFSLQKRWKEHCSDYQRRNYEKRPLYAAMKKYGIENFYIEQIEECPIEQIDNREKYWIEFYGSFINGYNATKGGDGTSYVDANIIYILWNNGKNLREIKDITGYDIGTIGNYLNDKGITHEQRMARGKAARNRPVAQIDPVTNQVIQTFPSSMSAGRAFGKKTNHIYEVCNGKRKTTLGFKWKYIEDL